MKRPHAYGNYNGGLEGDDYRSIPQEHGHSFKTTALQLGAFAALPILGMAGKSIFASAEQKAAKQAFNQTLTGKVLRGAKWGAAGAIATPFVAAGGAVAGAGYAAYAGRSSIAKAAWSGVKNTAGLGVGLTKGIAGLGVTAAGAITGGQPLYNFETGQFNRRVANLAIFGAAGAASVKTARALHQNRLAGYKTDYDTLEQRANKDLGATGSLALGFAQRAHNLHYLV